jgi:hypothetical protein
MEEEEINKDDLTVSNTFFLSLRKIFLSNRMVSKLLLLFFEPLVFWNFISVFFYGVLIRTFQILRM